MFVPLKKNSEILLFTSRRITESFQPAWSSRRKFQSQSIKGFPWWCSGYVIPGRGETIPGALQCGHSLFFKVNKNKKHHLWSFYYSIYKQVKSIARQVVVKAMKNIMLGRRIEMKVAWQYQTESLFEKVTCGQKLKKIESNSTSI